MATPSGLEPNTGGSKPPMLPITPQGHSIKFLAERVRFEKGFSPDIRNSYYTNIRTKL